MGIGQRILMRMFGRPQGLLGRLGGAIMARTNDKVGTWVVGLLDIAARDRVLEIGFGPGVVIQVVSRLASEGYVAGVDPSPVMVEQVRTRNAAAIRSGRVDLRQGQVEQLPFADRSFDKALSFNSMQMWSDRAAGLRELRRVLKPGGIMAFGFTPYSRQPREGIAETVVAAGFAAPTIVDKVGNFCVLARVQ